MTIRRGGPQDAEGVATVLQEAARWLEQSGKAMWRDNELTPARIAADVEAGSFHIAECEGQMAGVIKFQLEDLQFWPDVPQQQSAFVHRLAVRRGFAGGGISSALLGWAVDRARSLGKMYLRLDCEASRPKLRQVYERFGFRHHSDRQVGPYFVSRYQYEMKGLGGLSVQPGKPPDFVRGEAEERFGRGENKSPRLSRRHTTRAARSSGQFSDGRQNAPSSRARG